MTGQDEYQIVMSEFIPFLVNVLKEDQVEVKTEFNIYSNRKISNGCYRNICEYCLKNIDDDNDFIKMYFPCDDTSILNDIYHCDLEEHDIIVSYQQMIDELIQNVDCYPISNRKSFMLNYIVMLLEEVAESENVLDENTYAELYQLCSRMQNILNDPKCHFWVASKQKVLN